MQTQQFAKVDDVTSSVAEILRPPRRVLPADATAEVLRTEKGPWSPDLVPYCHEPLNHLGGRDYRGIVFVGPARTGKTMALILGGVTYIVTAAPGDMLIVQMSQDAARDFSRLDLDRAIRHSPGLAERMSPRAKDDNTFDKFFRSGIALKLGWPAVSQLSSKTLQYVFLTDYDRPRNVHDVDGEGPLWDLALKRIQTYMSRGKCLAESSPGEDQLDVRWQPRSPHEAPPVLGILSLYNSGTRARWYWKCQHCGEHFEAMPGLECFQLPPFKELCDIVLRKDLVTLANDWAEVFCPHCGAGHRPTERRALNHQEFAKDGRVLGATWLHDGESIEDGYIVGERRQADIASYWLGGVAAAYQTWPSILLNYLQAVEKYSRTGDEAPLKSTTNTDQGAPYVPLAIKNRRSGEDLALRVEDWPKGTIPDGVRFLTASVDVQLNRFVVQVMGWGEHLECWLVDRFDITGSRRPEGDGFAGIDPSGHVEDWQRIVDLVVNREYSYEDGAVLKPRLTTVDSGGAAGVTERAYAFWRTLRKQRLSRRLFLVKGDGRMNIPRVKESWPDASSRSDRKAGRGDVPVYILNVNVIKDGIVADLNREDYGPRYVHIPDWVEDEYFEEMTSEIRTPKGWEKQGKTANESFDLHVYNRAGAIILRAEAINWDKPPKWAQKPEPEDDPDDRDDKPKKRARKKRRPRKNWMTTW
jgi:phage terminase large subunit GpA-like protein